MTGRKTSKIFDKTVLMRSSATALFERASIFSNCPSRQNEHAQSNTQNPMF